MPSGAPPNNPTPQPALNLSRQCAKHPNRRAIGVCVITKQPICSECSTRHNGVNYSKEGLASLLASEVKKTQPKAGNSAGFLALLWLMMPFMILLMYVNINQGAQVFIDLIQEANGAIQLLEELEGEP